MSNAIKTAHDKFRNSYNTAKLLEAKWQQQQESAETDQDFDCADDTLSSMYTFRHQAISELVELLSESAKASPSCSDAMHLTRLADDANWDTAIATAKRLGF